mmetsp:Transcript_29542/g.95251  ORF Transcript_29542/g.95251 Transcript_29542/m.95251 type:complete len:210 (-) Transcript_29542:1206-1835(-)
MQLPVWLLVGLAARPPAQEQGWLDVIDGGEALKWVDGENARTVDQVGDPGASPLYPLIKGWYEATLAPPAPRTEPSRRRWQNAEVDVLSATLEFGPVVFAILRDDFLGRDVRGELYDFKAGSLLAAKDVVGGDPLATRFAVLFEPTNPRARAETCAKCKDFVAVRRPRGGRQDESALSHATRRGLDRHRRGRTADAVDHRVGLGRAASR